MRALCCCLFPCTDVSLWSAVVQAQRSGSIPYGRVIWGQRSLGSWPRNPHWHVDKCLMWGPGQPVSTAEGSKCLALEFWRWKDILSQAWVFPIIVFFFIFRGHVWWLSILFAVCLIFKGIVIKNENYIIIYSPLCCCKTVWLSYWNIEGWVFHRISKWLFSIKHKYTILFKSFIWKGCIKWIKTAKMKTTFQIHFIFNFLFIRAEVTKLVPGGPVSCRV